MACILDSPSIPAIEIPFAFDASCGLISPYYFGLIHGYTGIEFTISGEELIPSEFNPSGSGQAYFKLNYSGNCPDGGYVKPSRLYLCILQDNGDDTYSYVTSAYDYSDSAFRSGYFTAHSDKNYIIQIYNQSTASYDELCGWFSIESRCQLEAPIYDCLIQELPVPVEDSVSSNFSVVVPCAPPENIFYATDGYAKTLHWRSGEMNSGDVTRLDMLRLADDSDSHNFKIVLTKDSPTGPVQSYGAYSYSFGRDLYLQPYSDYYLTITPDYYLPADFTIELRLYNPCKSFMPILPTERMMFQTFSACRSVEYIGSYYGNRYYTREHYFSVPEYSDPVMFNFTFENHPSTTYKYWYMRIYDADTKSYVAAKSYMGRFYNNWSVLLQPGNYVLIIYDHQYYNSIGTYYLEIDAQIDYKNECEIYGMAAIEAMYSKSTEPELHEWLTIKTDEYIAESEFTECSPESQESINNFIQERGPVPERHDGMTPSKHDIEVWRGTSFELELVSQFKQYLYDPSVHHSVADGKRTHAENLEHYGYNLVYIDFATIYSRAELLVRKPWVSQTKSGEPIMELTVENGGLQLTDKSVRIGITAIDTQAITFDEAVFELNLIIDEQLTDEDVRAGVEPNDIVDKLIYGTMLVYGEK